MEIVTANVLYDVAQFEEETNPSSERIHLEIVMANVTDNVARFQGVTNPSFEGIL